MADQHSTTIIVPNLEEEYRQNWARAWGSAKEIITRQGEILELLGVPPGEIIPKLIKDSDGLYCRDTFYAVLPERFKRGYIREGSEIRLSTPEDVAESHLIKSLSRAWDFFDKCKYISHRYIAKLQSSSDMLLKVEKFIDPDILQEFEGHIDEGEKIIAEIADLQDERMIFNQEDRLMIVSLSATNSLRHIAHNFYELRQQQHGRASSKQIRKIIDKEKEKAYAKNLSTS